MSFLSSQYVAPSLNGIIELTDGEIMISNGRMSGASHIETDSLTINNTINVPEIITSNIQTQTGTLVIGDITDNITIYGNDIKFIGNVVGYEIANVLISDHSLDLNYQGGNLFLENAGLNILGDDNITISSLTTDSTGEWAFMSPNGNLTIQGTLKVPNVEIQNISFDNLSSGNIEATNKFIGNKSIIQNRVGRTMALSHLNAGDINTNILFTNEMRFSHNAPFKMSFGSGFIPTIIAGGTGQVGVTYSVPFKNAPFIVSTCAGTGISGFAQCYSIIPLGSVTRTTCLLQARNTSGVAVSNVTVNYIAIGL